MKTLNFGGFKVKKSATFVTLDFTMNLVKIISSLDVTLISELWEELILFDFATFFGAETVSVEQITEMIKVMPSVKTLEVSIEQAIILLMPDVFDMSVIVEENTAAFR